MKNIYFALILATLTFEHKVSAIFANKTISDTEALQGGSGNIVASLLEFANILAGIVLAISIIAMIAGSIHLKWRLEKGVQWHRDSRAKMIVITPGLGIIIALSAFAIGRLVASFAVV